MLGSDDDGDGDCGRVSSDLVFLGFVYCRLQVDFFHASSCEYCSNHDVVNAAWCHAHGVFVGIAMWHACASFFAG